MRRNLFAFALLALLALASLGYAVQRRAVERTATRQPTVTIWQSKDGPVTETRSLMSPAELAELQQRMPCGHPFGGYTAGNGLAVYRCAAGHSFVVREGTLVPY